MSNSRPAKLPDQGQLKARTGKNRPRSRRGQRTALGADPERRSDAVSAITRFAAVSDDPSGFGRHVHEYVHGCIQFADQKAGFLFALAGAVLAYEFEKGVHLGWLRSPGLWSPADVLGCVSMLSLLLAAILAVAVVLPRLSSSHQGSVFFCSIAEHESAESYAKKVASLSGGDLSSEILRHIYDLARVCKSKYAVLAWALWSVLIGVLCGITAIL